MFNNTDVLKRFGLKNIKILMNRRGFTLIELLVVVAIIGLLSMVITVAMGNARLKARDARRMSDLKQLQTALELYYNDNNHFPAGTAVDLGDASHSCLNDSGFTTTGCPGAFMGKVPTDPRAGTYYIYDSSGSSTYSVRTNLEGQVNGLSGAIQLTPSGIGSQ